MTPMPRSGAAIEALHAGLPEAAIAAFAGITVLGGFATLVGLAVGAYWGIDRRGGAVVLGVALGAIGLTIALKAVFGLPRPPGALWRVGASGFGFPSGHALGATATWGALARLVDVGTRRRRWAVAGAVIGLVALSRVVLGVHYPADVIAGVAVGAGYLGAVTWPRRSDPALALGAAVVVALAAVAATGGATDSFLVLGGSVGTLGGWYRIDVPRRPWGWVGVIPALLGLGAIGVAADAAAVPDLAGPVAAVVGGVAGAVAIALPAAVAAVRSTA